MARFGAEKMLGGAALAAVMLLAAGCAPGAPDAPRGDTSSAPIAPSSGSDTSASDPTSVPTAVAIVVIDVPDEVFDRVAPDITPKASTEAEHAYLNSLFAYTPNVPQENQFFVLALERGYGMCDDALIRHETVPVVAEGLKKLAQEQPSETTEAEIQLIDLWAGNAAMFLCPDLG